jgi:hypothetical protein
MKKLLSILILCTYICLPIAVFANPDTTDGDGDNVFDSVDNCISDSNQDQEDEDGDNIGDACDTSTLDEDGDGFPDEDDNCPSVKNQQYNRDGDDLGIACDPNEQEKALSGYETITDQATSDPEHSAEYDATVEAFGTCLGVNRGTICSYNSGGNVTFSEEPDSESRMRLLYEGLINNKITTLLEEPIGNDNIYQRARICETTFLKDKNGLLQFRNGGAFSPRFDQVATDEDLTRMLNEYRTKTVEGEEVIVTLGKCEEFFVEKCTPSTTETNNRFGRIGEPLPVKVFCDRVQVLFSTSGSDLVKNYVGLIYRWATGFVGVVAVLVIIINGIRMSTSNGDQSTVESARDSIIKSLTSIAILFLAGILLYSINPNFFTDSDLQARPEASEETDPETPPADSAADTQNNNEGVRDFTLPENTNTSSA